MSTRASPSTGTDLDVHYRDGTVVGEPEVRVRCADCHTPAWIRVSEVETARCPACREAWRQQFQPALEAIDGDSEAAEQLSLPVLTLIDGQVR